MTFFQFTMKAKKHIQVRPHTRHDGSIKNYYICNFGIPVGYIYMGARNILFDSKIDALKHTYSFYKNNPECMDKESKWDLETI